MLWSQCKHSVVWVSGRLGFGLWFVLQRAGGTCKPFLANAPEGSIRLTHTYASVGTRPVGAGKEAGGVVTREAREAVGAGTCKRQAVVCAVAAIEAGVGLAAVNVDLTEVSGKSGGTHT